MKRFVTHLREKQTGAEMRLWQQLRNRRCAGFKFRRQHVLGPYIVDFVCLKQKLVIEVDGGQHAQNTGYDRRRSAFLESLGFRVVRFWNNDVLLNTCGVMDVICRALSRASLPAGKKEKARAPHPAPLPARGERGLLR